MEQPSYPIVFIISRVTADALDLSTVRQKARAAGLKDPTLEYNSKNARGGYRITCRREMGVYLVERLKVIVSLAEETHSIDLMIAAATDIKAILDAIEESLKPPVKGASWSPY